MASSKGRFEPLWLPYCPKLDFSKFNPLIGVDSAPDLFNPFPFWGLVFQDRYESSKGDISIIVVISFNILQLFLLLST